VGESGPGCICHITVGTQYVSRPSEHHLSSRARK